MRGIPRNQLLAWFLALVGEIVLIVAAVLTLQVPAWTEPIWLEPFVKSITSIGAPILGLVIVLRQPRNRYGWLWLIYALFTAVRMLSVAYYLFNHSQFSGYSPLGLFLLWLSEPAGIGTILCMILLVLWFPDGQEPSRRWRFLYPWMLLATLFIGVYLFMIGTHWNGSDSAAQGIYIDNPFGWIPESYLRDYTFAALGFFSLVLISVLAVLALLLRYRSAKYLERLQIRWFVFGGSLFVLLFIGPLFVVVENPIFQIVLTIIGFASILPLYLATGVAILRYRLYEIDIIIRKTLQYTLVTGLLVLVYFGSIVVLQSFFHALTGDVSQVAIVISTLGIAAMFNPLRHRIQHIVDSRFYRSKYDAARALNAFSQTARDEVEFAQLESALLNVVRETFQPENAFLWIQGPKEVKE